MVPDWWKPPLGSSSFTSLLGGCFFAFELTVREEQKQDLGGWESGKGRAASFTTASHHKGIWRYIISSARQLDKQRQG